MGSKGGGHTRVRRLAAGMAWLGVTLPGGWHPPLTPRAPPPRHGCRRVRALPARLGAALFINWRSRGLGSSCRALAGHPARRHAATEPTGTVAPQPPQPGGTIGTRLPVGLAEPRGTQMSPWRPLGCGELLVQHVGMSGVSLCPAQSPPACPPCHFNLLLPPQPASCHLSLPTATPTRSCHNLPPATQPPSCHPDLPAVTPACSCLCVTSLQMELADGSKGVSPRQAQPAPGGTWPSPGCSTAPGVGCGPSIFSHRGLCWLRQTGFP